MTPGTGTGSIHNSFSGCLNCEKVFSLAEQLTKSMHEFEIFTMEMEFDPKSAKLKSHQVLSKFWQLILKIKSKSFKVPKKQTAQQVENQHQHQNPALSNLDVVGVEEHQVQKNPCENFGTENEPPRSKSNPICEMSQMRGGRQSKPHLNFNPNPYKTPKRLKELKQAKAFLRTVKYETPQGFYNVTECLKCQRQFNSRANGLRHVKVIHLNLGYPCPTCSQKYFDESSLHLHIPKCTQGKLRQLQQIKVSLKNDRKKPVKVQLHPFKKQQQKQKQKQKQMPSTRNQNQNQNSGNKIQNNGETPRETFNPLKIKVKNPFKNFSLEKTLNAKVVFERLKMEKRGKISSISQASTREKIGNDKRIETSSPGFTAAENENENENSSTSFYDFI